MRATGGLDDTISDGETGFKFEAYDPDALGEAWRRAILAYHSGSEFTAMIRRAMADR